MDQLADQVVSILGSHRGWMAPDESFIQLKAQENIEFRKYVIRLVEYGNKWCDDMPSLLRPIHETIGAKACYLAIDYLDRLWYTMDETCMHLYYAAAFTVAMKFLSDETLSLSYWATVCGVTLAIMKTVEMKMCIALHWSLHVTGERFNECVSYINSCGVVS
jgi:hypothetical protein